MRRARDEGFTLIEMIVVLAIVSILVTVTSPSLKSFSENRKLLAAGESIESLLLYASDLSKTTGESHVVVFSLDDGLYWLAKASALESATDLAQTVGVGAYGAEAEEQTETTETEAVARDRGAGVLGQAKRLVQGVTLTMIQVDRNSEVTSLTAGTEYVQFASSGKAEPASVYLLNSEGKAVVVDVPQDASRTASRKLSDEEISALGIEPM